MLTRLVFRYLDNVFLRASDTVVVRDERPPNYPTGKTGLPEADGFLQANGAQTRPGNSDADFQFLVFELREPGNSLYRVCAAIRSQDGHYGPSD